ncbi:hypothetical protein [Anaerosporobacter faecicola]|uniref:hypothetical protein n=1 Tax=Anaerosporobacter faecicola TaxID=2718714 RepID=UPI00143BF636|nr:hypothetical protein [Anaerosporobacter faecicola]
MEKVINLLYDIEEKANRIISRTDEQKNSKRREIDHELSEFETSLMDETNEKIQLLQKQADQELESEKKALIDDCAKQMDELENTFTKNHDALVEHVLQNIIGA